MDGDAYISPIIHDKNGELILVMENHFSLVGLVELVEASDMFSSIFKTLEANISLLWVQTNSKILWNRLVENDRCKNEVQTFVDAIQVIHLSSSIFGFLWAYQRWCLLLMF